MSRIFLFNIDNCLSKLERVKTKHYIENGYLIVKWLHADLTGRKQRGILKNAIYTPDYSSMRCVRNLKLKFRTHLYYKTQTWYAVVNHIRSVLRRSCRFLWGDMPIGYPIASRALIFGMDSKTSDDTSMFYTIPNIRAHTMVVFISPSKKMTWPEPFAWNPFIPITLNKTALNAYFPANRGAKLELLVNPIVA